MEAKPTYSNPRYTPEQDLQDAFQTELKVALCQINERLARLQNQVQSIDTTGDNQTNDYKHAITSPSRTSPKQLTQQDQTKVIQPQREANVCKVITNLQQKQVNINQNDTCIKNLKQHLLQIQQMKHQNSICKAILPSNSTTTTIKKPTCFDNSENINLPRQLPQLNKISQSSYYPQYKVSSQSPLQIAHPLQNQSYSQQNLQKTPYQNSQSKQRSASMHQDQWQVPKLDLDLVMKPISVSINNNTNSMTFAQKRVNPQIKQSQKRFQIKETMNNHYRPQLKFIESQSQTTNFPLQRINQNQTSINQTYPTQQDINISFEISKTKNHYTPVKQVLTCSGVSISPINLMPQQRQDKSKRHLQFHYNERVNKFAPARQTYTIHYLPQQQYRSVSSLFSIPPQAQIRNFYYRNSTLQRMY